MRTPEEIIGRDALMQLIFEGYEVVKIVDDIRSADFAIFWGIWPNKVGKPVAERAYKAARRRGAKHQDIIDGVARYMRSKPSDRPWLNPATFLNQDRFNDQPAQVAPQLRGIDKVRHELQQEIFDAGFGGEKGGGVEDVREFPLLAFERHQGRD